MNTSQLWCCIACDPQLQQRILGVFPADRLPKTITTFPCGFIANTDIHTAKGRHWCAFYFSSTQREAEFFDSYGKNPMYNSGHFAKWLDERVSYVTRSRKQIQSNYSKVCGLYCLFYLQQRLAGRSMQEIVKAFSADCLSANDEFIHRYMSATFSHCGVNECGHNQTCKPLITHI